MSVKVHCPHCGSEGRVNSRFQGRRVHCPKCNGWVDVPAATQEEDLSRNVTTASSVAEGKNLTSARRSIGDDDGVEVITIDDDDEMSTNADVLQPQLAKESFDIASSEIEASEGMDSAYSGDTAAALGSSLVTGATLHPSHEVTEGHALGLEFDDDDDEPPKRTKRDDGELDMTPMVDVTFLLLIFFMVTASFSLQKSIQMPRQQSDAPSMSVKEEETEELDSVEVQIDEYGAFLVLAPMFERETPGKLNLISALKEALDGGGGMEGMRLVIKVQEAAKLQALVDCMDAGALAGYAEIQVTQVEEFD